MTTDRRDAASEHGVNANQASASADGRRAQSVVGLSGEKFALVISPLSILIYGRNSLAAESDRNGAALRRVIMANKIPHNALVVVADGAGARFFRNSGHENKVSLSAQGEFKPTNLIDDGPAGKRPPESSDQETDEATFAKQLAKELYRRAHSGDFQALVLIADPQTLGQIRPTLHKEVQDRLIAKTLTKASIVDIQKSLN